MFKKSIYTAITAGALLFGAAAHAETITVTGQITSFNGMKALAVSPEGQIIGFNLATMPYNPTNPQLEPRLEKGDIVTFTGTASETDPVLLDATALVALQKPWENRVTYGQRLPDREDELSAIAPAAGHTEKPRYN